VKSGLFSTFHLEAPSGLRRSGEVCACICPHRNTTIPSLSVIRTCRPLMEPGLLGPPAWPGRRRRRRPGSASSRPLFVDLHNKRKRFSTISRYLTVQLLSKSLTLNPLVCPPPLLLFRSSRLSINNAAVAACCSSTSFWSSCGSNAGLISTALSLLLSEYGPEDFVEHGCGCVGPKRGDV